MSHPTRAATSRAAQQRPLIVGADQGRLHIDPSLLSPDYDWQWIRETTLGEYDEGNVQAALEQQGFLPVNSDELPGAAPIALPGRKAPDKLIRRGGLILMRRSKEIAQDQRQALAEANDEAIRSVTKDLSGRMDGRNFQDLPDRPVSVTTERGDEHGTRRFAE
jgi:hypothetical protein